MPTRKYLLWFLFFENNIFARIGDAPGVAIKDGTEGEGRFLAPPCCLGVVAEILGFDFGSDDDDLVVAAVLSERKQVRTMFRNETCLAFRAFFGADNAGRKLFIFGEF